MIVALTPSPATRRDATRRDLTNDRDLTGEPEVEPAPLNPREAIPEGDDGAGAATAVGIFFWLFVIFALIVFAARLSNLV